MGRRWQAAGPFAAAAGGGIFNGGLLTLLRTLVVNNRVTLAGPAGFAQGGGIWNSLIPIPALHAMPS